jgi:hypothetical protein
VVCPLLQQDINLLHLASTEWVFDLVPLFLSTGFTCVAAAYFVREEELPSLRVETTLCAAIGIDGFDAMT